MVFAGRVAAGRELFLTIFFVCGFRDRDEWPLLKRADMAD